MNADKTVTQLHSGSSAHTNTQQILNKGRLQNIFLTEMCASERANLLTKSIDANVWTCDPRFMNILQCRQCVADFTASHSTNGIRYYITIVCIIKLNTEKRHPRTVIWWIN